MQKFIVIFLLSLNSLSATYVIFNDEKILHEEQKAQLFDLILKGEPPHIYYHETPLDLEVKCREMLPFIDLHWIPPTLWQVAVLHAFFSDPEIQDGILACLGEGWDPLCYDEMVHRYLHSGQSLNELIEHFDKQTKSLPNIQDLFFKVNSAIASLYERGHGVDEEILHLAISEIPPLDEWKKRKFPFWNSPWIYDPNSIELFYKALKNESLLSQILKIERSAHKNGEWVLYRGYDGLGYPSTFQQNETVNHALSFGSTLLGGIFFSLEASAIKYYEPAMPIDHSFLALRLTPQEMRKVFRWGPLHPFIQMLVDGEMFHAHTKIASNLQDTYKRQRLNGYFMKCNHYGTDSIGYILSLEMTPEDLDHLFHSLCKKSGLIFDQSTKLSESAL